MPRRRRFPFVYRTKAFREALEAAPEHVRDAVRDVVVRLQNAQTDELHILPHWGDERIGDAFIVVVPGGDGLLVYRELLDHPALQLLQLVVPGD